MSTKACCVNKALEGLYSAYVEPDNPIFNQKYTSVAERISVFINQ
jgi:hypothetical protein